MTIPNQVTANGPKTGMSTASPVPTVYLPKRVREIKRLLKAYSMLCSPSDLRTIREACLNTERSATVTTGWTTQTVPTITLG